MYNLKVNELRDTGTETFLRQHIGDQVLLSLPLAHRPLYMVPMKTRSTVNKFNVKGFLNSDEVFINK